MAFRTFDRENKFGLFSYFIITQIQQITTNNRPKSEDQRFVVSFSILFWYSLNTNIVYISLRPLTRL